MANLQLIKTNYINPRNVRKYDKTDKFDKILLITKDEKGEKQLVTIEKPTLDYYISNDKAEVGKEYRSINIDLVDKHTTYYKDLYKNMVTTLNDPYINDYYESIINSDDKSGFNNKLKKIHLDYRYHNTDCNIEDHYISKFLDKHPSINANYELTKMFYDIEVDTEKIVGFPDPDLAECEINIISAAIRQGNDINVYMYCLHYTEEENPSYNDFFNNIQEKVSGVKERLSKHFKEKDNLKFIIKRFTNEVSLVESFFDTINTLKPDFLLGFNTHRFDFPYIHNRLKFLLQGTNRTIEDIMCPKEFPYKSVNYRVDYYNPDASDNSSIVNVASYTNHIDTMNLYANLRKGKGQLENYNLDAVVEIELGLHKKEITNISTQFKDDYCEFFEYSALDTLLLLLLEEKNKDIDLLFVIGNVTQTRVDQCLKKTTCLRNLAMKFCFANGKILSNNRSSLKPAPIRKRGALTLQAFQFKINSFNCWKLLRVC